MYVVSVSSAQKEPNFRLFGKDKVGNWQEGSLSTSTWNANDIHQQLLQKL